MLRILKRVAIALAVAIAATFLWFRRVDQAGVPTADVLVAAADVPAGKELDPTLLTVARWPIGTQPPGVYTAIADVVGFRTRFPIYRGEPIVLAHLAMSSPFGQEVPTSGRRAFAIRVDDVANIDGMARRDSRVDVFVGPRDPGSGRRVEKLFMENVRVLVINAVPRRDPADRSIAVTVDVTADQAEQLAIAQAQGPLQLVVRGYAPEARPLQVSKPR